MSSMTIQSGSKLTHLQQLAASLGVTAQIEIAESYHLAFRVGLLVLNVLRDSMIEVRSGQQFVGPLSCDSESFNDAVTVLGLTVNGQRQIRR